MPRDDLFSAQVILAPGADGARAQRAFESLGFSTGALVGGSFSIEAAADRFLETFGTRLAYDARGSVRKAGQPIESLPCERLPDSLRRLVADIVFTAPPDFGPGGVY